VTVKQNKARGVHGEYRVRNAIRAQGIRCERTGLMTVEEGEKRPDLKISTTDIYMTNPIMGEVKTKEKFPGWLKDAMEQGKLVFLNEVGGEIKVMLDLEEWAALHRVYYFGEEPDV
jgi:hypothetical protein